MHMPILNLQNILFHRFLSQGKKSTIEQSTSDQNTIRESSKNFFNTSDKLFSIEPALFNSSIKKSSALIIILGSAKDDAQNQNSELLNTPISL